MEPVLAWVKAVVWDLVVAWVRALEWVQVVAWDLVVDKAQDLALVHVHICNNNHLRLHKNLHLLSFRRNRAMKAV